LFAGLIFVGGNVVMAQQTLPAGGDSFNSMVYLIKTGFLVKNRKTNNI